MLGRLRHPALAGAAVASAALLALAQPAAASEASGESAPATTPSAGAAQQVTVERPTGQVVLSDVSIDATGHVAVSITDTRAEDPGWSVTISVAGVLDAAAYRFAPSVLTQTPAFTDSDGHAYGQQVDPGAPVVHTASVGGTWSAPLGSAAAGHGLGIARLGGVMKASHGLVASGLSTMTVTVTVV